MSSNANSSIARTPTGWWPVSDRPKDLRERGTDPTFYEGLGRAVKILRTALGVERKELAERSGVSYPYLSEIENGKKRPSTDALRAIADALGVSSSDLMAEAEAWSPSPAPPTVAGDRGDVVTAPPPPDLAASQPSAPAPRARSRRWFAPTAAPAPASMEPGVAPAALSERGSPAPDPFEAVNRLTTRAAPTEAREIMSRLSRLSPEDLRLVLDLIRRLGR
jgi:transcriptional regulator with XRE-family HTH domain